MGNYICKQPRERKGALSWKDWFTFLKKMPAPQRAAGFWLWMELKGFENDLGDSGCWHLTEPSLGPGLVIQSAGSGELPQTENLGVKAVISSSHEKDKLGKNKLLLCHVLLR